MDNFLRPRGNELIERAASIDEYDITIFVPCRNEEKNVGRALEEIRATLAQYSYTYEIIIIDDASTDNSVAIICEFIKCNPEINIVLKCNPIPMAVSYNFSDAAVLGRGKYFRMIGGHFQDRRKAMENAFDQLGKADMILTYIYPDYRISHRRFLSRIYTQLVNLVTGYNIRHYHGTPIHRRIDILRWHSYRSAGFYADMTTRLLDEGVSYIEVPTEAVEREWGKSHSLSIKNVCSIIVGLSDMLLRRFSKERIPPMKLDAVGSPNHV